MRPWGPGITNSSVPERRGKNPLSLSLPTMRGDQFVEAVLRLVDRGREGFQAFAATVDLIGIKDQMVKRKHEARARLDDLQQGFGEALAFFPGGEEYRVCFAGDSVFVVRELEPGADTGSLWASFCGHIYALAGFLDDMDRQIGNPGLRVVVAAGPLFQLTEPDSWKKLPWRRDTANWFVLTGAAAALRKCVKAEALGRAAGFLPGYCWHEQPAPAGSFLGTRLQSVPLEYAQCPALYERFYREMVARADKTATLPGWQANSALQPTGAE
jgi:hypothetical protein